ncbi:hypothetical protein B0T20DRAFT_466373 [Sordaria brevicollis]|uniref:Uncharacterized protein n=1 Tax=Sordaria brevicollis TaxID=83679 RepID=A0AAE0PJQ8_SORBR|nr:hypothetical protein B0T20DRAFT_466373 [Sordaria brevicollis]
MNALRDIPTEQWRSQLNKIKLDRGPHVATVQCLPSIWNTRFILEILGKLPRGRGKGKLELGVYVTPDKRASEILKDQDVACDADWHVISAPEVCQKLESGQAWVHDSGRAYESIIAIFDAAYVSTTPHMVAASAGILRFMAERFKAGGLFCCAAIALTDGQQPFFPTIHQLQEIDIRVNVTHHRLDNKRPEIIVSGPGGPRESSESSIQDNADTLTRHLFLHDDDVKLGLEQRPRVSPKHKILVCMADPETARALGNAMTDDASPLAAYIRKNLPSHHVQTLICTRESEYGFPANSIIKKTSKTVLFIEPGVRFVRPFLDATPGSRTHFALLRNNLSAFSRKHVQMTKKSEAVSQQELTLFAEMGRTFSCSNEPSVTILDRDASIVNIPEAPSSISLAWAQDPMATLFLLAAVDPTRRVDKYLAVVALQARVDCQLTSGMLRDLIERGLLKKVKPGDEFSAAHQLTAEGSQVLQFFHRSPDPITLADAVLLYYGSVMESDAAKRTLAVMRCILKLELDAFFPDPANTPSSSQVSDLVKDLELGHMCYKGPLWTALGIVWLAFGKYSHRLSELGKFKLMESYTEQFQRALAATHTLLDLPDASLDPWVCSSLTDDDIIAVEKALAISLIDYIAVTEDLFGDSRSMEAYDILSSTTLLIGPSDIAWFKPVSDQAALVQDGYRKFLIHQPYQIEDAAKELKKERIKGRVRKERIKGRVRKESYYYTKGLGKKERIKGRVRKERIKGRVRKERIKGRVRKERIKGRKKERIKGRVRKERIKGRVRKERIKGRVRKERIKGRVRKERKKGLGKKERIKGRVRKERKKERIKGRVRGKERKGKERIKGRLKGLGKKGYYYTGKERIKGRLKGLGKGKERIKGRLKGLGKKGYYYTGKERIKGRLKGLGKGKERIKGRLKGLGKKGYYYTGKERIKGRLKGLGKGKESKKIKKDKRKVKRVRGKERKGKESKKIKKDKRKLKGLGKKERIKGRVRKERIKGRVRKERIKGRVRKERIKEERKKERIKGRVRKERIKGRVRKERIKGRVRKERIKGRVRKERKKERIKGRVRKERIKEGLGKGKERIKGRLKGLGKKGYYYTVI